MASRMKALYEETVRGALMEKYGYKSPMEIPKFEKIVNHHKLDNLNVESNEDMVVCLDGEIYHWKQIKIEVIKHGVQMLFPRKKND